MSGSSAPFLTRWLAWGWIVAFPVSLASAAYSFYSVQACRTAAAQRSLAVPECGPGLTLGPGQSCSVTIPILPTPSLAPRGLFPPHVVPS